MSEPFHQCSRTHITLTYHRRNITLSIDKRPSHFTRTKSLDPCQSSTTNVLTTKQPLKRRENSIVHKQLILYTKQTALFRLSSSVHYYKITQICCYIVGFQTTKFPLLQKSKTEVGVGNVDSLDHRLLSVCLCSVLYL